MSRTKSAPAPLPAALVLAALALAAPAATQEIDREARIAAENALRETVTAALVKGDPGPALAALKAGHAGYFELFSAYDPTVSMLTIAIQAKQVGAVKALLEAGVGLDLGVDQNTIYDWSAAIETGDGRIVKLLLAHGADPNQRLSWRSNGEPVGGSSTPLTEAAAAGHIAIVLTLLAAGADPNGVAIETAFDPASSSFFGFSYRSALDCAATPTIQAPIAVKGGLYASMLPTVGRMATVTDSGLRVRGEPNTSGAILTKLEAGTIVRALATGPNEVIDGKESRWIRVVLPDGMLGWVFAAYLSWK